jgi:hypothetical protein
MNEIQRFVIGGFMLSFKMSPKEVIETGIEHGTVTVLLLSQQNYLIS